MIALVGNGPLAPGQPREIASFEHVIRFNRAPAFEPGAPVDALWLVNCGGQMKEWLELADWHLDPVLAAAENVVLPIPPEISGAAPPPDPEDAQAVLDAQNHTAAARIRLEAMGKSVRVVDPATYLDACKLLETSPDPTRDKQPSTGFIALVDTLRRTDAPIHLFGFGFQGWDGHDWTAERHLGESLQKEGRIVIHPCATMVSSPPGDA